MKRCGLILGLIGLVMTMSCPAMAWTSNTRFGKKTRTITQKLAVGAQWHGGIPDLEDLPLDDGDLSAKLVYEYHDSAAFWQLGATYTSSPDQEGVDYVLTPELNLIFKQDIYRLGAGALKSKVRSETDSYWTSVYWQVIAGVGIPLGDSFSFDIYGHYVFKEWGSLGDSDNGNVNFSALIAVSF
jgi:hypothetical protein